MVWNCRCHRQSASAGGDRKETFLWDGLALIRRDGTNYVNEPAVTGGNPVIAGDKTLFNDMLGSTLGAKTGGEFSVIERDAFGQTETASDYDFFTGKPHIGELGYAFLFRNYRANLGKWQTADPTGYPDGWNNLAYVNNNVTKYIDWQGAAWKEVADVDGRKNYVPATDSRMLTPVNYGSLGQCDVTVFTVITFSFELVEFYTEENDDSKQIYYFYRVTKITDIYNVYTPILPGIAPVTGAHNITNDIIGTTTRVIYFEKVE
ncbi:MAG: hypothetical protein HPZ91_06755 [Lentisphaeria bacterium]|nr:hypothetical protein [Lentisphaeria bacterium]